MTTAASIEPPRIYLVHRHADKATAERLATTLRTEYGIDVWVEHWEILPGENEILRIEQGLERADGALVLVTPAGLDEPMVPRRGGASS